MMLLHQLFKPYIGHGQWVIILIQVSIAFCCCLFYISLCAYVSMLCTRGVTVVDQQTCERRDVEAGWHCPHSHHWLKTYSSKQHKLVTWRRCVKFQAFHVLVWNLSEQFCNVHCLKIQTWKVEKNSDLIGQHKTLTQNFWFVLCCPVKISSVLFNLSVLFQNVSGFRIFFSKSPFGDLGSTGSA